MSQWSCPLCGKNNSLDFDPEDFDLDVKLVTFRGLGQGHGFAVDKVESILGDDDICPKLAKRVLLLVKMFLDAGVINIDDVINKFGPIFNGNKHFSDSEVLKIMNERDYYIAQCSSVSNELSDVKRKEEERKIIDDKLREIYKVIKCEVCLDESPYLLKINEPEDDDLLFLFKYFYEMNYKLKQNVMKRIVSNDFRTEAVLEAIRSMHGKKSLADVLVDLDLNAFKAGSFPPRY